MGLGKLDPHLLLFKDDIGCGHSTVVGGPTGHSGNFLASYRYTKGLFADGDRAPFGSTHGRKVIRATENV